MPIRHYFPIFRTNHLFSLSQTGLSLIYCSKSSKTMVKHIVMFKLSGTPAERLDVATAFKNALEALPEQIEVLRTIEVGLNQNPAEDWDVVLTAIVDTMADVEVYAKHPAHVAAAALLAGHKELRACVDYQF